MMQDRGILCIAGVTAAFLTLTACDTAREQLGLNKQSPDEFRVVARAPLTLPPDFSLRPPAPGVPRPQEGTATDQARRAVFRAEPEPSETPAQVASAGARSEGERAFLKSAGAEKTDPGIRALINRETAEINDSNFEFLERLMFWRDEEPPGELVDADAEARRLRENAALGKDVTAGETPTIERRKKAFLEGIF